MKNSTILTTLCVLCGLLIGASWSTEAQAKKSITFTNNSGGKVKVKLIFTAAGCAGVTSGVWYVCKKKTFTVANGATVKLTYKYKWGTTRRYGNIICKAKKGWRWVTANQKLSLKGSLVSGPNMKCKHY